MHSTIPEDQALVARFKDEFAEYKCEKCECECETYRECECECECPSVWKNTTKKPSRMTTAAARASGARTKAKREELEGYLNTNTDPPRGLKTRYKELVEKEPFKDESVFMKYFGDDWDMIKRIAVDPAHQFYNLVKDYLALIIDYGSMKLTKEHLDAEQDKGRFHDVTLGKAPWHVSKKFKKIITGLVKNLKVAHGRPSLMDYFTDEYEKIKIAEALAFCGDIGCYLTDLTDMVADLKSVFIDLLRVCEGFISKTSTKTQLARFQRRLVRASIHILI
jgi:hypothetical protein